MPLVDVLHDAKQHGLAVVPGRLRPAGLRKHLLAEGDGLLLLWKAPTGIRSTKAKSGGLEVACRAIESGAALPKHWLGAVRSLLPPSLEGLHESDQGMYFRFQCDEVCDSTFSRDTHV